MTVNLTTPTGRIVQGNPYRLEVKKDAKGVVKLGKDGQPVKTAYFALAIPKQPGYTHWSQSGWGAKIWADGHASAPNNAQHPSFAWKIEDGDSTVPNKVGKVNASREGFPGHWIMKISSGFVPAMYTLIGRPPKDPAQLTNEGEIQCGYFVQVNLNVTFNASSESPGMYLNPALICLMAYGQQIVSGPDVESAGFGEDASLPAGASMTPVGAFTPPVAVAGPAVPQPAPPAPTSAVALPPPPAPQHTALPLPPPPVAATPQSRMTPAAQASYDGYIAAGWSEAQLIANGYMTA